MNDQDYSLLLSQFGPTEEDKQAARRMGFMRAGLGILSANAPSPHPKSTLSILAQGGMHGLDGYGADLKQRTDERKASSLMALQAQKIKRDMEAQRLFEEMFPQTGAAPATGNPMVPGPNASVMAGSGDVIPAGAPAAPPAPRPNGPTPDQIGRLGMMDPARGTFALKHYEATQGNVNWVDAGNVLIPMRNGQPVPGLLPVPKQMSPGEAGRIGWDQFTHFNPSAHQRAQLGIDQARLGNEGARLQWETGATPTTTVAPQAPAPQPAASVPSGQPPAPRITPKAAAELAVERAKNQPKARMNLDQARAKADVVVTRIDKALDNTGIWTAGPVGAATSKIPGSPAFNLARTIDPIIANLGFQELAQMRAASPTGGALGQVAVRELEMLQAAVASLAQGQGPEQLRENLKAVKTHFQNWKAAVEQSYKEEYGSLPTQRDTSPAPSTPQLPPGVKVRRVGG